MAKWILDQYTGPELDYPSLGFRADAGEILDATAAPDARWSLHSNEAAAETVTRYALGIDPNYVEPTNGHVLTWSNPGNAYVPTAPQTALQTDLEPAMAGILGSGGTFDTELRRYDLADKTLASTQTWLNAIPSGAVAELVGGLTINDTLSVPAGVILDLSAATIAQTVATKTTISLAAGASLRGGKIVSPATFDGTNGPSWTYAVVEVMGDNSRVTGVTLENVPRVGIGVRGDNALVSDNNITGNYPSASWTGVETMHFGVTLDPSASATKGNFTVTGNVIRSCVQGVFVGPYDGGGPARGVTVTGNTFEGCWNHGVYLYGEGASIGGNTFNRCQIPVATSGPRHSITGNSMYAEITGTDQRDLTGISCREAIGCIVADNAIRGNAPTGSVIIDIRCTDTTVCTDNIVHDNTIYVEGGTSQAIRVGVNATTCENNSVTGNVIRSVGAPGLGVIHMTAATTALGLDNRVTDNTLVMRGDTHGIYITYQDGCVVAGNKVRLEYDAAAAKTLGMVAVNSNSVRTEVRHNSFKVTAAWGTNVTLRAIYEFAGVTDNLYRDNEYRLNATKLAAAVPLFVQAGSRIHEAGVGAPTVAAVVGSTWLRTDGAAATTLYVKESGTSSAGWVGK